MTYVSGQESDDPPCTTSYVQSGSELDLSPPSSINSSPKRVKMDGDGDGAPSANAMTTSTDSATFSADKPDRAKDTSGDTATAGKGHSKGGYHTFPRPNSSRSSRGAAGSGGGADLSSLDMKTSWDGSAVSTGSGKGEAGTSAVGNGGTTGNGTTTVVSGHTPFGYVVAFKAKAGMLADPVKIAKEREKEERVRQARERLAEERRRKLEELREQQRIAQENRERQLEMRRKKIEDLRRRDVERRAAVEERRKMKEEIERARRESILQKAEERVARYEAWKAGGRKGMFGEGGSKLSMSTSVLYHKRNPDFSSMNVLSPAARPAESSLDRSKSRPHRRDKEAKDKENEAKAAEDTPDGDEKSGRRRPVNKSFYDRLSTPKFHKASVEIKEPSPRKDAPIIRRSSLRDKPSPAKDPNQKVTTPGRESTPKAPTPRTSSTPRSTGPRSSSHGTATTPGSGTPRGSLTGSSATSNVKPASSPARAVSPGRSSSPAVKGSTSGSSSPRVISPTPAASVTSTPAAATPATPAEKVAEQQDGTPPARPTQDITAEEYKARLAEKRRQARERAEREAEEERKRQEEARLAEEERQRQEEEEQRHLEEESLRLAEEARKAEAERLERAIQAEEKRKREEAERLEAERKAKEEAERKAKEEAERLELEKQEKARKAEEERQERKRKLEMIMKRVKPDSAQSDSPSRGEGGSPTKSVMYSSSPSPSVGAPLSGHASPAANSGQSSPTEEHAKAVDDVPAEHAGREKSPIDQGETTTTTAAESEERAASGGSSEEETDAAMTTSQVIRSASSGDILDSAEPAVQDSSFTTPAKPVSEDVDSKPRFKSPLLQQLVENKGGDSPSGTPKFKSPLLQNLLGKTKVGARMGLSASMGDLTHNKEGTSPAAGAVTGGQQPAATDSGSHKEISKQGLEEDKDEDTLGSVTNGLGGSTTSAATTVTGGEDSAMNDSALGSSLGPHQVGEGSGLYNGHHSAPHSNGAMEDSSISLHSVEETTSVSPSQPYNPPVVPGEGSGQFEEIIDLLDGATKSPPGPGHAPIIAFDQNRRPDVSESLS